MENFTKGRSAEGIYEFTHCSGLKLLLVPQNGLEVTTANITYHVGSRNEGLGVRGATHYLEHGMFKGSKNFNKKQKNGMWKLEEFGAYMNATTYTDRTNYFAVIDSDKLNEVIMREADRMFQPLRNLIKGPKIIYPYHEKHGHSPKYIDRENSIHAISQAIKNDP